MSEMGIGKDIDAYIASFRAGEQDRLQREAERQAEAQAATVRRADLHHAATNLVRGYATELIKTVSKRMIRTEKPILNIADVLHEQRDFYEYTRIVTVTDYCVFLGLSDGAILSSSKSPASPSRGEYLSNGAHLATDDDIIPLSIFSANPDPNQQLYVMRYRNQLIKVGAYLLGGLPDPGFLSIYLPSQL